MSDYYFNLPPLHALTEDQRRAVNEPNPLALSGGPGTGKTTVSIYRYLRKHREGVNCQLLTYTRSLALYFGECCASESLDLDPSVRSRAKQNIDTVYQWLLKFNDPDNNREEIIVDEAQDSGRSEKCTDIYGCFKEKYPNISFGCDDNQMLHKKHGINYQELISKFAQNSVFRLEKSFRGTKGIMKLARELFSEANISDEMIEGCQNGNLPYLYITNKKTEKVLEILKHFANDGHNIAILCAYRKEVDLWFKEVSNYYPDCTYYFNSDESGTNSRIDRIGNIHITTFKSAKGLEFDTVIIPHFEGLNNYYRDIITWRDYYVGITRAKRNLFLISTKDIINSDGLVEKFKI